MALTLSIVVLASLLADWALGRLRLPGLLGMLLVGGICGPFLLDIIHPSVLSVSADLRRLALVVILLRAGLSTRRATLHRFGRPVALLAFVPAGLEALAVFAASRYLLGLPSLSAALLGVVLAGVSPAVTVPMMLDFIARGRGQKRGVPSLVLAAAPLDNVVVVVLFSALAGAGGAGGMAGAAVWGQLARAPVALATGTALGLLLGHALYRGFVRYGPRATKRALIVIAVSVILVSAEGTVQRLAPFSGLMAVMALGCVVLERSEQAAAEIAAKLSKIWVLTEILLFVLIGATVDPAYIWRAGLVGAAVLVAGLCARSAGAYLCLLGTELTPSERLFCVASGIPKATIQAAIGATPLAMGVPGGELILAVAVLAIAVTAPAGAVLTRLVGERALEGGAGGLVEPVPLP